MDTNTATLALIADLYAQLTAAQQELTQLRNQVQEAPPTTRADRTE